MKNLIASLILFISAAASASSGNLVFTEGYEKGQVASSSSFIGIYGTCFVGNPYAVKAKMYSWLGEDIEKDKAFVKVDLKKNRLVFGYVSTKCMDDSSDATEAQCRDLIIIPACKG